MDLKPRAGPSRELRPRPGKCKTWCRSGTALDILNALSPKEKLRERQRVVKAVASLSSMGSGQSSPIGGQDKEIFDSDYDSPISEALSIYPTRGDTQNVR
ncbi:hypothetical protein NDU88_004289 [Pleurodeles waltl]|uniref:Uncharacterized protein n=1 Tax=Pleurodeles waltl TaxID=8319 RepID=A0AAV7KXF6_PLEWA|nr:hypothetical protein NDU88_004289 [Pleurodeles waltl]